MTEEKPQIPPDHVLLENAAKILKASGYDITYNGLYYYRRLGILPAPERLSKSKFKYYKIYDLVEVMFVVDFLRGVFHLNMEEVASLIKGARLENVRSLVETYFMTMDLALDKARRGEGGEIGAINIISRWTDIYERGVRAIAKTDRNILEKYSKSDYLKVICKQTEASSKEDKMQNRMIIDGIITGLKKHDEKT